MAALTMARDFKPGERVHCPADMGAPSYRGEVLEVGEAELTNSAGQPYRWIKVRHPYGHSVIWPSNRLS